MSQAELQFNGKKRNILKSQEEYRLLKWMEANHGTYLTTIAAEVAEDAAEELGFAITGHNITAARHLLGYPTPRDARRIARNRPVEQILAYEIARILKELEFPIPRSIEEIVDGTYEAGR